MKTLPQLYLKHFRKRAHQAWPVWEIGTDVACGDVGTFEDKMFVKTGTLKGRVDDALLKVERNPVPGQEVFSSHADMSMTGNAGGTPAPGVSLSGKISFGASGGVYFEANTLMEHRLAQLGALRKALRGQQIIERDEVFISNVWTFGAATLLVADTVGWTLDISGKAPPLPIKLADAAINLSVSSGSGYKRTITGDKSIHPMGVRVQGRRGWFSDRITTLDTVGTPDMAEYIDVTQAHDD